MNLRAFYSDPAVELPLRWDRVPHTDYVKFVQDSMNNYLAKVRGIEEADIKALVMGDYSALEDCCRNIVDSIRTYHDGHPHKAYDKLETAIESIRCELLESSAASVPKWPLCLYRMRRSPVPLHGLSSMFHIPFEERHRIGSQRYSIPGIPCLYLAGSIYACWEELNRPPFHELYASAFWIAENKKWRVMTLSVTPTYAKNFLDTDGSHKPQDTNFHVRHIRMWPIVAASSVCVRNRDGLFKPEHVVPQMLLQWIRNNSDVDGVYYFSNRVTSYKDHPLPISNFVFPVKTSASRGRCPSLCDFFRLTEPISWQMLESNPFSSLPNHTPCSFSFEMIPGIRDDYLSTTFGTVEYRLDKLASRDMSIGGQCGAVSPD